MGHLLEVLMCVRLSALPFSYLCINRICIFLGYIGIKSSAPFERVLYFKHKHRDDRGLTLVFLHFLNRSHKCMYKCSMDILSARGLITRCFSVGCWKYIFRTSRVHLTYIALNRNRDRTYIYCITANC